jgi:hypothetical protein
MMKLRLEVEGERGRGECSGDSACEAGDRGDMSEGREDVEKGLDGLEADVGEVGLVVMEVGESSGGSETASDGIEANDTG